MIKSLGRRNRTLSLDEVNFRRFKALCQKEGDTVSQRIDELIGAYLSL